MPPLLNTHTHCTVTYYSHMLCGHTNSLHTYILSTHAMQTHAFSLHVHILVMHTMDTLHAHTHLLCTLTLHTHGSAHTHYIPLAPTATTLRLPGSLQLPRLEGDSSSSLFLPSSRAQAPTPSFPSGRPRCGEGGERETKPFSKNHPFPSIPSRTLLGCPRASQLTLPVPYL